MGCCQSKPSNVIIKIASNINLPTNENEWIPKKIASAQTPAISKPINVELSAFISHKTSRIDEDYLIGECICIGGLGSVRKAIHRPTKQERAIKTIKKMNINTDLRVKCQFFNEVDVLRKICHPNIVKLFEFYEDEKCFHLVMELLKGGDLVSYLLQEGKVSEQTTAYFFRQLLSAVNHCHSKGIVHRDLKLDHLLLESSRHNASLKVVDFGTASWFEPSKRLTRKYGTTFYIAPEVLRRSYSEKCDIWSCGVILFILLSGSPPFDGQNENEILSKILKGSYSFTSPSWSSVSAEAKKFISELLTYNEDDRPSAYQALQNDWLTMNSKTYGKSCFEVLPIFNNLKQFNSKQKLQRAILTFISSQLLSNNEANELAEFFRHIDENGDGKISEKELLKAYEQKYSKNRAAEEVKRIMDQVDTDKSGFIDYGEFIIATMTKDKLLNKKNLEIAFKVFDRDGSGKITLEELKDYLGNETIGSQMAWEEILKEDRNNDGEIDFGEFLRIINNMFI